MRNIPDRCVSASAGKPARSMKSCIRTPSTPFRTSCAVRFRAIGSDIFIQIERACFLCRLCTTGDNALQQILQDRASPGEAAVEILLQFMCQWAAAGAVDFAIQRGA